MMLNKVCKQSLIILFVFYIGDENTLNVDLSSVIGTLGRVEFRYGLHFRLKAAAHEDASNPFDISTWKFGIVPMRKQVTTPEKIEHRSGSHISMR